jgi:23S rRNA (uracil1939-C5)-methyltransferase
MHTLETKPPQVIYLSCNPATQARDLAKLQEVYDISYFEAFNFFPHTPHIETLAVLTRK